jgi:hypothetical protein
MSKSHSRPLYESNKDLANEASVAFFLQKKWRCRFSKLGIKYGIDYAIMRDNEIVAVAEVKCRDYSAQRIAELGGYMIGAHKLLAGITISEVFQVPFLLVIRLLDQVYFARINRSVHMRLVLGGRVDRNDIQDIEPCALIPMTSFVRVYV